MRLFQVFCCYEKFWDENLALSLFACLFLYSTCIHQVSMLYSILVGILVGSGHLAWTKIDRILPLLFVGNNNRQIMLGYEKCKEKTNSGKRGIWQRREWSEGVGSANMWRRSIRAEGTASAKVTVCGAAPGWQGVQLTQNDRGEDHQWGGHMGRPESKRMEPQGCEKDYSFRSERVGRVSRKRAARSHWP